MYSSKYFLTYMLTGGQTKSLMLVTLNPNLESHGETFNTLKFAKKATGVELGAAQSTKEAKDFLGQVLQHVCDFS